MAGREVVGDGDPERTRSPAAIARTIEATRACGVVRLLPGDDRQQARGGRRTRSGRRRLEPRRDQGEVAGRPG